MGITREHLSNASDDIKTWILELTGDIFVGLSPSILKLGAIAPLPKDSKRFRPITLLEPITKLVTGTVARRLSLLFHTHSLLHHHQFGFVHGGSCEAPIEVVNDMYEHAIEHNEQLHVAFLDATSAFDTVQHPALTAAFSSIGASASFIRWIKFMVAGHRRVIRTAYSMGDPASEFTIESGTPQGDPLSPLLWATVVDFALRHARNAGASGFTALGRTPCQLLCYADDIALFANTRSQLHTTIQAIATALAAIGVRLNAAKSYYAPSPTVTNIQPMTFIALDSEGVLREQQMTLVPCEEAVRYLGVWFSFLGPAGHTDGRWAHQIKKLTGVITSFFEKCSSLHPSFAQMSEVLESTLIRRLLFPIQSGVPVWHLLDRVRGLTSQWIHRTLGFRGSATGNDNVADVMHTPRACGGLGIPDIMSIYIECMASTWLAGAHSHVPVVRQAYLSRINMQTSPASAVHIPSTLSARQTPSLNRLFSLNNAGIRIHSGSGGSIHSRNNWTPRSSITTYNGPHTFGSNNHWHDQLVQNLVQTPKFHIYAPNTIGDYNLRLRSQLILPPKHTGFLLIPNHPNDCDRHIALHILLRRIHLPHYACIGFVSLPEAIFHAHHTVNYSVTIRAIRMDGECKDLQDLSTVTGCVAHGIDSDSSTCRHAVSLGLFVYHPSGPQRDRLTRQYPTGLSTHDLTVPIPGWTPPPPDEDMSPDRELHTTARDWAESMNMSSQLVIHTSQWMMGFHPFFLDNPNTITSLQTPHTDYLFLSHSTLATHRPRINRNRTRYGAVFPSLLDALIYASRHDDTNHITLLVAGLVHAFDSWQRCV